MSKLSKGDKFLDLSDYGRPVAVAVASRLKHTLVTPVQITYLFGICGLFAVYCILNGYYATAGLLLILKSIIDAMDGELARVKQRPSYTGRYLDSVFDIILNFIVLLAVWYVDQNTIWAMLLAFICLQLQGTLYNYYYVIVRHNSEEGDTTSKIFETSVPKAYPQENQKTVTYLFKIYRFFYSTFDKVIYRLDSGAPENGRFPKWFMTMISFYGLGFQLLIIAIFLSLGLINLIIPFFIFSSLLILIFVGMRRILLNTDMSERVIYRD